MSRTVEKIKRAGWLTLREADAIDFAMLLEENEEDMAEGAAMALTCEMQGVDYEDHVALLADLPDGDWWTVMELPVKIMEPS